MSDGSCRAKRGNELVWCSVPEAKQSTQIFLISDLRIRDEMEVNVAQRALCSTLERYSVEKQSISTQIIQGARLVLGAVGKTIDSNNSMLIVH